MCKVELLFPCRRQPISSKSIFQWIVLAFEISLFLIHLTAASPDYCMLPPDKGNCSETLYKYFYDSELKECYMFVYGGCGGNKNNFGDKFSCKKICTGNYTNEDDPLQIIHGRWLVSEETEELSSEETTRPSVTAVSPLLALYKKKGSVFTFDSASSYIQLDSHELSNYQIRNRRRVSLEFRTRLPHALLVYHGIVNRPSNIQNYELYVMLDQGMVKIKHLFGDSSTTLVVGKGLNRDKWHQVSVLIDPHEQKIIAQVDDVEKSVNIDGLNQHRLYGAKDIDLKSTIFVGGLSSRDDTVDISYFANPMIGCIKNVRLESSPLKVGALEPLQPLISKTFQSIQENCLNKCWEPTVKCSRDSVCINHYDHVECDCFNAKFKGEKCKDTNTYLLTLKGYSYVTYTVYEWMDRVHSDFNRISLKFLTHLDDSILLYAVGEIPYHNHVAASIVNHTIVVDIDFGDEEPIKKQFYNKVTDGTWHTLTIDHHGRNVTIHLDHHKQHYVRNGRHHHLYIDPDVYIGGGGPILNKRKGLQSLNNFVGCLEEVYFNAVSILYELHEHNLKAQHHGLTPPVFDKSCNPQKTVPITIPFAASGFKVANPTAPDLHLKFSFKTTEPFGTLAYSDMRTLQGEGFWELKFSIDKISLEFYNDKTLADISSPTVISVNYNRISSHWHHIKLEYKDGKVALSADGSTSKQDISLVHLSGIIILGTSSYHPQSGFLGCMRRVEIAGKFIDARQIVGSDDQIGDIALDNCQFMDPCKRPDVCEHGGKCEKINGSLSCNCLDTGYTGKHCHFATFKRTCEELALLGYTESGVYKIDIDGNGPYPPAHVKCKFETDESGETKTIVEHNLRNETDIWTREHSEEYDFKLELEYREFTTEMLWSLISQSVQCSQRIKYDCYKAKLGLHQFTWFKSADPSASKVVSIGDAKRNTCPCYSEGNCVQGEQCNCDSSDEKYLSDEGIFTSPDRLGITELNFVRPKDQDPDATARITLGPLECVEANTQRYVVTFKTFGSYLEAPGWKSGDLAFSFRTTRSSAILLYQPLLHSQHNSFSVFLTNDHELTFRFVLSGKPPQIVTVRSQRSLSGGDWQQVWIDYDLHQVRFQINREHQMINLPDGQQFGPFEGIMYIAGAPKNRLEKEDLEVKEGLIGCFRGLVMNGQVVDLYSYMKFHKADIVKDCSPSCDPNPCKNNGVCQENWGSFTCQCENPWAHTGKLCETDINEDGLTFLSQSSYVKRQSLVTGDPIENVLDSNIYLNLRTYDKDALVLYANDNLNNFVQLHIEDGTNVTFKWNDLHFIHRLSVFHKRLNHGNPIQIAVLRNSTHTVLHVNEYSGFEISGVKLLDKYTVEPWNNPNMETFTPPRPFAPAAPYYQLFLAGFDNTAVKPAKNATAIPGMLGCLRGFKIGNEAVSISEFANADDVLEGCKMVCDAKPCSNGGVCMEDFQYRNHSCDCTFTSYYGAKCDEEKGAAFEGESYIRRRFSNPINGVPEVEARFGFSSKYAGDHLPTVLLTAQIPGQKYSIFFGINEHGHLFVRETNGSRTEGATIRYQHFIDGSRHSVYYKRNSEETLFIVDQEVIKITLKNVKVKKFNPIPDQKLNVGEVFIGGVNEAVPEFEQFSRFKGCISNIYLRINREVLKPMDEYFGWLKKPADQLLDVEIPVGIKLDSCGDASSPSRVTFSPGVKDTPLPTEETFWNMAEPSRVRLQSRKQEEVKSAGISFDTIALILGAYLAIIFLGVAFYACKLQKQYKLRKLYDDEDDDDFRSQYRNSPVRYPEPGVELKYMGYSSTNSERTNLIIDSDRDKYTHQTYNNGHVSGRNVSPETPDNATEREDNDDDTTSRNESDPNSEHEVSMVSDVENVDDKEDGDFDEVSIPCSPTSPPVSKIDGDLTHIPEEDEELHDEKITSPTKTRPTGTISPIVLSETARTFETSPLAVIGGERYKNLKRTSKDSIVSLD